MQGEIQQEQWQAYLDGFSKRNYGRIADLQVFSDDLGTQQEAETLSFEGITFDTKGSLALSVEIMLGGAGSADNRNLTHTVTKVRRIVPKTGLDGRDDALEIETGDDAKIILIFKALPATTTKSPMNIPSGLSDCRAVHPRILISSRFLKVPALLLIDTNHLIEDAQSGRFLPHCRAPLWISSMELCPQRKRHQEGND